MSGAAGAGWRQHHQLRRTSEARKERPDLRLQDLGGHAWFPLRVMSCCGRGMKEIWQSTD